MNQTLQIAKFIVRCTNTMRYRHNEILFTGSEIQGNTTNINYIKNIFYVTILLDSKTNCAKKQGVSAKHN